MEARQSMDFYKYLIDNHQIYLNEQQQKAVTHIDGPVLLLAVPGAGKTTVMVSRIANMVINHGIQPSNILTLTFSKASALDMKRRFHAIFGKVIDKSIPFSTIHSFCYSVLKTYSNRIRTVFPTLIEDEKAPMTKNQLLRQIYKKHLKEYLTDDKLDELSNEISYVKNKILEGDRLKAFNAGIKGFHEIYHIYEKVKAEYHWMDFDDMLTKSYTLLKDHPDLLEVFQNRYTYINVDESQDTSYLQHQIIKLLAKPRNNIFMVGDEDQSIYTFRAASPEILLDFPDTYPGAQVYLMENNYRSTQRIVAATNGFIKQNQGRYDKNMVTQNAEGAPIQYQCFPNQQDQYIQIISALEKDKEFYQTAVLYRNNLSAIPLADAFHRRGIPFYQREAKMHFFKHWVTIDILSFMDFSVDPSNIEAFRQIYYKINAYLFKGMMEYAATEGKPEVNLLDVLLGYPDMAENTLVRLNELKLCFKTLSQLAPLKAIDFIVQHIGYGEYLKKQGDEGNSGSDSYFQIINGLKRIAEGQNNRDEFKQRLMSLQQVMEHSKFNKGKNAVTFSTIHSSKGLEFKRVFMIDLYDGQFPSSSSIKEFKEGRRSLMEEEVRLFYVGATRAEESLVLMAAKGLDQKKMKPSRFIEKLMQPPKPNLKRSRKKHCSEKPSPYSASRSVSADELFVGMAVWHNKFGVGNIRSVNLAADILKIEFKKKGLKWFAISTCIQGNIIQRVENKEEEGAAQEVFKNKSIEELRELALAIGKTGVGKEHLRELFWHEDYEVRRRACSAANKLKDQEVTKHIIPCLYAKEPQIRQYALRAVENSRCYCLMDHIKKAMHYEDKEYNIRLCEVILKALKQ